MPSHKNHLFVAIFLISVLGLVTIWSTAPSLFVTQVSFFVAGAIIIYLHSKLDINLLLSITPVLYILSILLLLITFVFGKNIRGSVRWIDLGFLNLQTSELVKPFLALFYASYLAKKPIRNTIDFLKFLGLALIPVAIIAKQPDLGSALVVLIIPIFLLAFSGHFKKLLVIGVVSTFIIFPLGGEILKPYQLQRIQSFINPYHDPQGAGYNVIQSTIAIGSGKLIGKGVRLGTQSHLNFLPERHTDFIFASFVEEFGLFGSILLIFAYYILLKSCLKGVRFLKDRAHSLLSLSIFSILLFQIAVNVGMNLGIMPVTGITLPLFSYGGSSILSFAILLGLQVKLLDLITPFEI